MEKWQRGDLVEFDGILAAVVGLEGESGVPEGHVALWFGEPQGQRKSMGGRGSLRPIVLSSSRPDCSRGILRACSDTRRAALIENRLYLQIQTPALAERIRARLIPWLTGTAARA